ncbi:TRAP transporter substrate-binding protein [Chloroflexota bacterium]
MKRLGFLLAGIIIVALIFGAIGCGGEEATPTPKPTAAPTAAPTVTAAPTATPVPTPTIPTMEPVTWKLTHGYPEDGSRGKVATKFKELVEEYTDGKITVDVFHNSTLFSKDRSWEATVTGAVDVDLCVPYFAAKAVPWFGVLYVGGMFENYEHARNILLDPRLLDLMKSDVEPLGIYPLGLMLNSVNAGDLTKVEVTEMADLRGIKSGLRPGAPVTASMKYRDLTLVEIPSEEQVTAFQTGLIDHLSWGIETLIAWECWELADYVLISMQCLDATALNVSKKSWDALPAYYQDIIENKVFPEVQEYAFQLVEEVEGGAVDLLSEHMTVHVATPEDMAKMWNTIKEWPEMEATMEMAGPELLQIIDENRPSAK